MLAKPRRRRQAPDLETNTARTTLREARPRTPPDSTPPPEDAELSDYEREIDRIDAATRANGS